VTGLTNGDRYTFTVAATNATGIGPPSAKSNGAIPSPPLSGVRSTASDGDGYCAVRSTGGVDCWGDNSIGELGNGNTRGGYDTPQAVTGMTDAVAVISDADPGLSDPGGYCAVLSTNRMVCWGDNGFGELGDGTIGGPDGQGGYDTPQAVSSL